MERAHAHRDLYAEFADRANDLARLAASPTRREPDPLCDGDPMCDQRTAMGKRLPIWSMMRIKRRRRLWAFWRMALRAWNYLPRSAGRLAARQVELRKLCRFDTKKWTVFSVFVPSNRLVEDVLRSECWLCAA